MAVVFETVSNKIHITLYADDTNLILTGSNINDIILELNNILKDFWTGTFTGYDIVQDKSEYEYKTLETKEQVVEQKVDVICSYDVEVDYLEVKND